MDHDSNDIAFFSDSLLTPFITGATGFQPKNPNVGVHGSSSRFIKRTHSFQLGLDWLISDTK